MAKKALIIDGHAVNVVEASDLATSFHPDIAKDFVSVPDVVEQGWRKTGSTWSAPESVEEAAPYLPPEAFVIDVPGFKMRFTPAQLVAIRASGDGAVKAFLSEILDDPRTTAVNLALPFVQSAVAHLATVNLIAEADVSAILASV